MVSKFSVLWAWMRVWIDDHFLSVDLQNSLKYSNRYDKLNYLFN